jgi:hypothetical protein
LTEIWFNYQLKWREISMLFYEIAGVKKMGRKEDEKFICQAVVKYCCAAV